MEEVPDPGPCNILDWIDWMVHLLSLHLHPRDSGAESVPPVLSIAVPRELFWLDVWSSANAEAPAEAEVGVCWGVTKVQYAYSDYLTLPYLD